MTNDFYAMVQRYDHCLPNSTVGKKRLMLTLFFADRVQGYIGIYVLRLLASTDEDSQFDVVVIGHNTKLSTATTTRRAVYEKVAVYF